MRRILAIITPFYRPSIGGVEYIVYHIAKDLIGMSYEMYHSILREDVYA